MRKQLCFLTLAMFAVAFAFVSCGGGGGNNNNGGGQTVSVTGVSLNKNTMTLTAGSSETLTQTITPSNATNKGVAWTSSNDAIASVSGGRVTAIAQGSATITVRTNDGGYTATCSVTVNPATTTVPVTGVSLNKNTMTLTVGGTEQLTHIIQPSNATNQNVTLESNNSAIAAVNNGLVTAMAPGSAVITVRTVDGNHTATCAVTVNPATTTVPVTGVSLNKNTMTLTEGGTEQLTHTIQPANATNQNVTWESSNNAVATVANGLVTAIAQGNATITVRTVDGNHTATCAVTVINPAPDTSWYYDNPTATTFTIYDAGQLAGLAVLVNNGTSNFSGKTIILGNNIDLSAYASGDGWIPIGDNSRRFSGVFDGNGKTISNLTINRTSDNYIGLFGYVGGYVSGGTVQNLGIVNASINGGSNVGGIAGIVQQDSSITNCYSTGVISGTGNSAGGIAGSVTNSSIANCYSTGSVSGSGNYVGGIAGSVGSSSSITNCYSTGAVSGNINVGGIAGSVGYYSSITNCYNTGGAVSGSNDVGGIAGDVLSSSITNCYSTGSVSGSGNYVGGIAGYVYIDSSITNCYSTGAVSGNSNVGGIAGSVEYNSSITNCYSTGSVSGISNGGNVGGIAGSAVGSSSITNCAALNASVTSSGSSGIGRVAGYLSGSDNTLSNNIAWSGMLVDGTAVSGAANDKNGANKTAAEIHNGSAFNGMFTDSVWTKQNGYLPGLFGQPVPIPPHIANAPAVAPPAPDTSWYNSAATTFTLNTAEQLAGLAELVNSGADTFSGKTIILGNNIDLFAHAGGEGWTPIGDYYGYRPFSGIFNGGYKTISNLTINRTSDDYIGLFGYVSYGKIQNLGVVNASISGDNYIGGVAGYVYGANIMNCYSAGVISGTGNFVGGVTGYIYDSSAENCYSTAAISGNTYVGGVAGDVANSSITSCAALNVSVTTSSGSVIDIGRVAGYADIESTLSNNIAWSGMLVNGVTVSGTANDVNGANKTAAEIQNGNAFNGMFTDSVWTKQAGYLPGLFGQTVPIPAHIN